MSPAFEISCGYETFQGVTDVSLELFPDDRGVVIVVIIEERAMSLSGYGVPLALKHGSFVPLHVIVSVIIRFIFVYYSLLLCLKVFKSFITTCLCSITVRT